jgi:hypothetical protein
MIVKERSMMMKMKKKLLHNNNKDLHLKKLK